ncbi:MAG: cupin domain-containing protein [Deltaproteobacteria bacterium]|jgi:mannose-6-phosphate isomerase-like protein (cupin superfamily)|nr:cupin domain-containing protein [Deltaproteobacteria bacterium]
MIVRRIEDPEVVSTTYRAHGGGVARMVMDSRFLQGILFLAHAVLPPGNRLEDHRDPYEEIYMIHQGSGLMRVGDEEREVKEGDAIWIPVGEVHGLKNTTKAVTTIYVIAAYPHTE